MTLKEVYEKDIESAKSEVERLEGELVALPSQFHDIEAHIWTQIEAFFTSKG